MALPGRTTALVGGYAGTCRQTCAEQGKDCFGVSKMVYKVIAVIVPGFETGLVFHDQCHAEMYDGLPGYFVQSREDGSTI